MKASRILSPALATVYALATGFSREERLAEHLLRNSNGCLTLSVLFESEAVNDFDVLVSTDELVRAFRLIGYDALVVEKQHRKPRRLKSKAKALAMDNAPTASLLLLDETGQPCGDCTLLGGTDLFFEWYGRAA